jgi:CubicO group peptidase (beta-lactamase class C family)
MNKRTIAGILLVSILAPVTPADARELSSITEAMKPFVEKQEVSGVVTVVAGREKILHVSAVGLANVEKNTPMSADTIFWIASMTKPITAAAILALQDDGKLNIDDPIGKYIPELKDLKTADGKVHVVTIRHILSHTSGMAEASNEQTKNAKSLADLIPAYAARPLVFAPNAKWSYCQSGINTAGRIVEVVSGMSLPEFFERRFFGPMGMKDTTFYLSESQMPRLALSYKRGADGKLEAAPNFILQGKSPTDRDRYPAANGGLYSTGPDYARFCQMLLNNGTLDGKTYLKSESVKLMSTVTTGELKTGFTPGNGWGIGCCIVREPQGVTAMLSPGTFGHGGAHGTQAWIDPAKGVAYVLMIQRSNFANMGGADGSDVRKAFQDAAAGALK